MDALPTPRLPQTHLELLLGNYPAHLMPQFLEQGRSHLFPQAHGGQLSVLTVECSG